MSGALSDFVENCQEEAKQHFGLTSMETYLDALQHYKSIPEPTAEDHRCMIYLIFAMMEKMSDAMIEHCRNRTIGSDYCET